MSPRRPRHLTFLCPWDVFTALVEPLAPVGLLLSVGPSRILSSKRFWWCGAAPSTSRRSGAATWSSVRGWRPWRTERMQHRGDVHNRQGVSYLQVPLQKSRLQALMERFPRIERLAAGASLAVIRVGRKRLGHYLFLPVIPDKRIHVYVVHLFDRVLNHSHLVVVNQ